MGRDKPPQGTGKERGLRPCPSERARPNNAPKGHYYRRLVMRPTRRAPAADRFDLIRKRETDEESVMGVIWTIIIGFIAGVIAKFIMPGDKEPIGFVWTTILGIVGAFVATWLGQAVGWYHFGEGAGLIGAVVGAVIVLVIYNFIAGQRTPNRM
jgi:uncharacterized membrane protein YeaQ/YmgE (transglycosylase-associated protein family)